MGMGHSITAVIGSPDVIARVVSAAGCPQPISLIGGLQIAPLGHDQIDKLTALHPGEHVDGFNYLSAALRLALMNAVQEGTAAYIETDYFGGVGSQAATVFSDGSFAIPEETTFPINAALRALGVRAAPGVDEFDTLGLSRFRDLESLGIAEPDED